MKRMILMPPRYDRVYWWSGGTEVGQWRETQIGADENAWDVAERIMYGGRVAFAGRSTIGPPEGPPKASWWERIGRIRICDAMSETQRGLWGTGKGKRQGGTTL